MKHTRDIGYSTGKGFFITMPARIHKHTNAFPYALGELVPVNGKYYDHLIDAECAREEIETKYPI